VKIKMSRFSRVVVLGSCVVGKSALIQSVLGHPLDVKEYEPTQSCSMIRTNTCIPSLSPTNNPSDACCVQEFEIVDTPGKIGYAKTIPFSSIRVLISILSIPVSKNFIF